ncbi:MAG: hypothetical protein BIFFINMI_00892 [Phycisphaerae bacterium]|nr:hypothetical protein [Phycisphaerae bacterium]
MGCSRRTGAGVWLPFSFAILLSAASAAMAAGESAPTFTKQPSAVADGDKVRIAFAVSRSTDVAVRIEDARGQVVRHLVAGVLGPKPPAPLKADSLEQSLLWDRRDDLGKPADAAAGPFSVRVSLGLKPTLDRFLAYDPSHLESVRALACGPDGSLYVFDTYGETHPRDGSTVCKVFSREGKYLRTILPYPSTLSDEKLKGVKRVTLPDGSKAPFIYQFETRSFIKGLGDLPCQQPVVTSDGRLAFVGIQEGPRPNAQPGEARLTVVGTDGSVPSEPPGALIAPLSDTGASLALSADEKTVFATGVRIATHPVSPFSAFICNQCDHDPSWHVWKHTLPTGWVFRFRWDDPQVQVLNSQPLKEPVSVATDKADNVYVADVADNRVVVFRGDAMPGGNQYRPGEMSPEEARFKYSNRLPEIIGEVKIDAPQRVAVHKATGAIYVLHGTKDLELVKIDGYKSGRIVARQMLFHLRNESALTPIRRPTMALDETAEHPIIWAGTQVYFLAMQGGGTPSPVGVVDLGDEFSEPAPLLPRLTLTTDRPEGVAPMELSLDRVHDILYLNNWWRCHLAENRWEKLTLSAQFSNYGPGNFTAFASGAAGCDGNYYAIAGARSSTVARFDSAMQFVPFSAPLPATVSPQNRAKKKGCIVGSLAEHNSGLAADAFGNVYVGWRDIDRRTGERLYDRGAGDVDRARKIRSYDKDGNPRGDRNGLLVDCGIPGIYCVRVDFAGNIYLAASLRPGKSQLPPGLQGRLPEGPRDPDAVNGVNNYPLIYGSIVKFPPAGGAIRGGIGGVACNYAYGLPIDVQGAEWIAPGVSTVLSSATPRLDPGTILTCGCELPGIDVDGFGRCFYGDTGRFRVGVLDTAGNEICTFGTYGNQDATGPGIGLCWPQAVAVGDRAAYVGDRMNRRIVRVILSASAEAACPAP